MLHTQLAMDGFTKLFVAILCFLLLVCYWKRKTNSLFPDWPIFGILPPLVCNLWHFHDYTTQALRQQGGTGEFKGPWFTNMNILITCDPLNVHHILTKNFSNYVKGPEYPEIFEAFGDGVFSSDAETWKHNRNIMHLLFKQKSFEVLLQKIVQNKIHSCLLPFLDHFHEQRKELDLQDVFHRLTFDTNCSKVMGFDTNGLSLDFPQVAFQNAFEEMGNGLLHRHTVPKSIWKLQKWLQVGQEKKMTKACETFDRFIREVLASKSKAANNTRNDDMEETPADLLTALIQNEKQKGQADHKFLRDTAFNLFVSGLDGIAVGLTWFFWLVATHPLVEAKILEEIKEKFSVKAGNQMVLGAEEVRKLVYLHAALCEALRLFPPLPFVRKNALNSDILPSGHHIDANKMIIYSLYAMGRSKEIWGEDCLEFKPERWISQKGGIVHVAAYKFISFNAGPRSCLGKELALIEMKMVASAILWNFHIDVVEGQLISPDISIGLFMKHGLKVRIAKRDMRWQSMVPI